MHRLRGFRASVSAAAALLVAPGLAPAAVPTGSFEIQFGGNQSIWAGEPGVDQGEQFCEEFEAEFDSLDSCDFDIFVDGKGKIFGYFGFSGWVDGLYFEEGGPIRGTQRGDDRSGISRISFKIRLTGTASDGFETLPTRSTIRLSQQTTAGGSLSGIWSTRVCIQGAGCNEAEEPVPPEILTNGGWTLQIEITDQGDDTLGGSARTEFGDGSECLYFVSGKYSPRKDTAKLRLNPAEPECEGTSLRLKDVRLFSGPPDQIVGSIAYRLFGFRGDTEFGVLPGLLPATRQPFPVSGGAQGTSGGSNQELFAWVCEGTVAIAASVDPSACSWSAIPTSREEIVDRQWALAEELERALIPRDPVTPVELPLPSFGRREFIFLEESALYPQYPYYYGSGSATISVIGTLPTTTTIEPEVRDRLEELQP